MFISADNIYRSFRVEAAKYKCFTVCEIDLVEVLAPYLILYVIPSKSKRKIGILNILKSIFRLFICFTCGLFSGESKVTNYESLALGFSENHLKDVLVPVVNKLHYNNIKLTEKIRGEYKEFSIWKYADISNIYQTLCLIISFLFRSIQFYRIYKFECKDLTGKWQTFYKFFIWESVKLIPYIVIGKKIVVSTKPRFLMATDLVDQRCIILIHLSRLLLNSRVFFLQQGFMSKSYPEYKYIHADYYLCYGNSSSFVLSQQGVPQECIIPIGVPLFDKYSNYNPELNAFIFASQPYYEGSFTSNNIRKKMIFDLVQIFISNESIRLAIKPHPHESISEWDWIKGKYSNIDIITDPVFNNVVTNYGVLITFYSTVMLDAMSIGMPVINIMYDNSTYHSHLIPDNISAVAHNPIDLRNYIESYSDKEGRLSALDSMSDARKSYILENMHINDKCATNRAADAITKVMNESRTCHV